MHNYLTDIVKETQTQVDALKAVVNENATHPFHAMSLPKLKSLKHALSQEAVNVIAEIKRKSPSKGTLAEIADPVALAETYAEAGAAAISVLTNQIGFNGSLKDLSAVADALKSTPLAILRKDFIIDPIQIIEAIYYGADAVLLIVAVTQFKTAELLKTCQKYHIDALVEVHTEAELTLALEYNAQIIGINNRNLSTFEIDKMNALRLKKLIPENVITVAESGIDSIDTAKKYIDAGFNALLIGETLVQAKNPQEFIRDVKNAKD